MAPSGREEGRAAAQPPPRPQNKERGPDHPGPRALQLLVLLLHLRLGPVALGLRHGNPTFPLAGVLALATIIRRLAASLPLTRVDPLAVDLRLGGTVPRGENLVGATRDEESRDGRCQDGILPVHCDNLPKKVKCADGAHGLRRLCPLRCSQWDLVSREYTISNT